MSEREMRNRPEILSPAGNFEKMKFAVLYGADAVYVAGKSFGMRAASENFSDEELIYAVKYCHDRGVKLYVTVNVMPRQYELYLLPDYLKFLNDQAKPDALIISDMGVFSMAEKYAPDIDIHISTQASTVNSEACKMYHSMGAKRIVLSRELTLTEIKMIRADIPEELELEAFVHGAMCVSYSGRCLLSNFFTGRDANRGQCAQPCRWEYFEGEKYAEIFEKKRPEEKISLIENEQGTFMFSSKDMCMIEHIPELVEAGIDSFKIEGRVKSAYYTALTANAYKTELMRYVEQGENYRFDSKSLYELESVSHREYGTGYFFDDCHENAQISKDGGYIRDKAFLSTVVSFDRETSRATLCQWNKSCEGQICELVSPGVYSREFTLTDMRDMNGEKIESSPHPRMLFTVSAPFEFKEGDIVRGQ